MRIFQKVTSLTLALLLMPACHMYEPLMEGREISNAAAGKFHAKFNEQQYRDIYLQAEASFRNNTKESDFVELLEAVSRKIGKVVSSDETSFHADGYESTGITVNLQLRTRFEGGYAAERFVWSVKNKEAKLLSYTITSPELIRK